MDIRRFSSISGGRRIAALFIITGALCATSGGRALAQSSAAEGGLTGAWKVTVTLRDCASGAAQGAPFTSLASFHRGGTLSESAATTAFAPGQRTAGHGTWTHTRGNTYMQQISALIVFSTEPNLSGSSGFNPAVPVSPGFFAGGTTITHQIELIDADHATSSGVNEFYKADGTVYRTGCSTARMLRLK